MKPRVLLDVDGVLADFIHDYLMVLRAETGIEATRDDVTHWDTAESLGLRMEEAAQVRMWISNRRQFARGLLVYPGAIDGVAMLREVADIHIVTSPWNSNETWCHDREWWLKKHFGFSSADVTHTSAKHLVRGDYLIDDKTKTCREWQAFNRTGIAIQWANPHNRLDEWFGMSTNDWTKVRDLVLARTLPEQSPMIGTRHDD